MKIILTENVPDLGNAGELMDVKNGYFRNYLQPRNLAIEANPKNVKMFEHQKRLLDSKVARSFSDAQKFSEKLETVSLTLSKKAGKEDKLFGSVTDMDIEEALKEQGFEINRKQIVLEEPIKMLGVYQIPIKLHKDVEAKVKVWVIKE